MFDLSKKNEKFIGANKNQNKYQNKESRGESPIRKTSTNSSMPTRNPTTGSSNTQANNTISSIPPTPGGLGSNKSKNSKLQQLSRNASVVPLSNNTIKIDIFNNTNNYSTGTNYNNNIIKILDRPGSGIKNGNLQQMVNINFRKPIMIFYFVT